MGGIANLFLAVVGLIILVVGLVSLIRKKMIIRYRRELTGRRAATVSLIYIITGAVMALAILLPALHVRVTQGTSITIWVICIGILLVTNFLALVV